MAENRKLPDAGFIYDGPRYWPRSEPWQPKAGNCRASVHDRDSRSFNSHQCSKKAKVVRKVLHHGKEVEFGYCGLHDPVAVAEKRAKREAAWRAKWDAEQAAWKAKQDARELAERAERAIEALRQIAAGHNDPRSLAIEVLGPPNPLTDVGE